MSFEKHRDEVEKFGIDFKDRLAGVSISSVDELTILDPEGRDVSVEFGSPSGAIVSDQIQFTLGAASSEKQQLAGIYILRCKITTSGSETMVETPRLVVSSELRSP